MATEATATTAKSATKRAPEAEPEAVSEICVIDFGEHSRRAIKRLRRGEGRLMDKVEDAIQSLREEEIIGDSAQTVVVIVREEDDLIDFFDRDDDDYDDDDD